MASNNKVKERKLNKEEARNKRLTKMMVDISRVKNFEHPTNKKEGQNGK